MTNTCTFQVLQTRRGNRIFHLGTACLPYVPVVLPVLLFSRLTELKLDLHSFFEVNSVNDGNIKIWHSMMEEKMMLQHMANDVKIIGRYN